jgi:hypothetical protein
MSLSIFNDDEDGKSMTKYEIRSIPVFIVKYTDQYSSIDIPTTDLYFNLQTDEEGHGAEKDGSITTLHLTW